MSVDPGATCLERGRLVQRVTGWLQRPAVEAPLRVHVRGDPRVRTRVFFAVVTDPGSAAERRLDNVPSDCDQLHSAVALSVALAIEATLKDGIVTPATAAPAARIRDRSKPAAPMHLELGLLGGASIGVLTDTSATGVPRLSLSPLPWLQIALAGLGTHLGGQTLRRVRGSFSATVLALGLDACFGGETTQRLGFFMCVGGRGGVFRSAGRDFDRPRAPLSSPWWALTGSGQARVWFTSLLAIGASVEVLYALQPPSIRVEPLDPTLPVVARDVQRVALSVTVGPVFRFF